mmetsp:Transcript_82331/g.218158  ORF Transcript_82331/g.218158 Transcript_82331/m.218158 type:complete len:303 (+) Transcript_82331:132-1040(+)
MLITSSSLSSGQPSASSGYTVAGVPGSSGPGSSAVATGAAGAAASAPPDASTARAEPLPQPPHPSSSSSSSSSSGSGSHPQSPTGGPLASARSPRSRGRIVSSSAGTRGPRMLAHVRLCPNTLRTDSAKEAHESANCSANCSAIVAAPPSSLPASQPSSSQSSRSVPMGGSPATACRTRAPRLSSPTPRSATATATDPSGTTSPARRLATAAKRSGRQRRIACRSGSASTLAASPYPATTADSSMPTARSRRASATSATEAPGRNGGSPLAHAALAEPPRGAAAPRDRQQARLYIASPENVP